MLLLNKTKDITNTTNNYENKNKNNVIDNEELQDAAGLLIQIMEAKKFLEQHESKLKTIIKGNVNPGESIQCPVGSLMVSEKSRENVDKKKILAEHGEDFLSKYTTKVTFKTVNVSKK